MNSDYYGNIRSLLRFLTRDGEDGYAFATARHEGLMPAVNRELIQQAKAKRKRIEEVWYEPEEDQTFSETLRQAASEANALIVMGLDKPLQEDKDFVINLNFAREAITALGKPVLLWLNPESLTVVMNQAADLFSQRRISTVQFEQAPELAAPSLELERRFREEYRSSEDYEQLRNRVNLLKKQLVEATEAGIPRQRIARDIVFPLAETYSELDLHEEALGLLEEYKDVWDDGDARELFMRGGILRGGNRYSEAIACLEKSTQILEDKDTEMELATEIYTKLGDIQREVGHLDQAVQYYERNQNLREKILTKDFSSEEKKRALGIAFNRLGEIYREQGRLNQALECFEKCNQIFEDLYTTNSLSEDNKKWVAETYHWFGDIYESQGKLNQAMVFFEKHLEYLNDLTSINPTSELTTELAVSYNRLGHISQTQGKNKQALEFFEKNLQLIESLYVTNPLSEKLKNYLAIAYIRIGGIYYSQGKLNKALEFFEKDLEISKALHYSNSISENLKDSLASSYHWIGTVYISQGKLKKALRFIEKSLQLRNELYTANPLSEKLKNGLAWSYNGLGGFFELQGDLKKAQEFFGKGLQIIIELHADNPLSEDIKSGLAWSYKRLSQLSTRSGKWSKAISYCWKELIASWQLCRYVNWARHKMGVLNSFSNLLWTVILPPPFSIILLWLGEKVDLLYKRLRYGPDK